MRAQAAQVIAAIAVIEIPRGEWSELIPSLCQAVQGEADGGVKLSSMLTLGYICEDLRPEDMDQDTKNKIV